MRKSGTGWIELKYIVNIIYILLLVLILSTIYANSQQTAVPKFKLDFNSPHRNSQPFFESYIIPEPKFLLSSHSSTLEVLPNDNLIVFWFAGSHEGKADVKIWSAKFVDNKWSYAKAVISPQQLSNKLFQYIHKVGNPVVYVDQYGILHIFVVSVGAIGGWSGSNINHLRSIDGGETWQFVQKLVLTPFFNISMLVRTNIVSLADGGFYLPVYDELIYQYPELLYFDKYGNFIRKIRMSSNHGLLQPAIAADNQKIAYAFLRNKGRDNQVLYMQYTKDGGINWSLPLATNLTNRDSSIAVGRLDNKLWLMAHNPMDRDKLVLSISSDGVHWRDIKVLENALNQEYSYPSMKIHDGWVDIVYTYRRQGIKHIRFNQAWLYR